MIRDSQYRGTVYPIVGPSRLLVARLQIDSSLIWIHVRQVQRRQGWSLRETIYHFFENGANAATKIRDDCSLQAPCAHTTQAPHLSTIAGLEVTLRVKSHSNNRIHTSSFHRLIGARLVELAKV